MVLAFLSIFCLVESLAPGTWGLTVELEDDPDADEDPRLPALSATGKVVAVPQFLNFPLLLVMKWLRSTFDVIYDPLIFLQLQVKVVPEKAHELQDLS